MGLITLGLVEIQVGIAAPNGTMPGALTKLGKTYQDTAKIGQDAADVTEHFEEGHAAPEVRKKTKKIPKLTFSIMDADAKALADYVGGTYTPAAPADGETPAVVESWGFDGSELTSNVAIKVVTEQGLDFEIPNADVEAVINADMSAKGIFLVDFTVTPLAVTSGKAIRGVMKSEDEEGD